MSDEPFFTLGLTMIWTLLPKIDPGVARRLRLLARVLLLVGVVVLAQIALGWMNLRGFRTACELFLVFLVLAYLASSASGRLRDCLVVIASLAIGLSALAALAVTWEKPAFPVVKKGFNAPRPGIGWGASGPGVYPSRKTDPRTGDVVYDVTYTIDNSLLRKTESVGDGPTIAFFGDSFTFGEGVNDSETMPQALADLTNHRLRVLNLGFPGYGPQHVLYALESGDFDPTLGSHLRLVVLMTAPWHAERTACKPTYALRGPRYQLIDDHVTRSGACSEGLSLVLKEWIQNTDLYRLTLEPYRQQIDHDDIELYIRIVVTAVELAKKKYGVATLIPYLPVGDDYLRPTGFTDISIVKRFKDAGAEVIDVSLAKERAAGAVIDIPGDGHPTAFAHFARAQSIKAYIAGAMPVLLTR